MKKNTYGVAAIPISWPSRVVRYAVVHYQGRADGVDHFIVSANRHREQGAAITEAKKMNARKQ